MKLTRLATVAVCLGFALAALHAQPAPDRWDQYPEYRRANAFIRELCERDSRLTQIRVEEHMLGADGKPRPELYVADGVHLSEASYKIWTSLLAPLLAGK